MEVIYAAYGLRLVSSFPLPGMRTASPAGDGLRALELALLEPTQFERAWSGSGGPPEWRGRQGDGRELTIEHGTGGDVLFSYADLARFRLDPQMRRLECFPSDTGLDWLRVLISKVIPSISVMLGHEALHAAALDSPEGVVAIMAPSGAGKSTLALELLRRGWPLFADDVLTLDRCEGRVSAHPGTPHMNLAQERAEGDTQTLGETLGVVGGERWLAVTSTTTHKRPVRMLCLLERGSDLPLEIEALESSPLPLAPYMLGLSSDPFRRRERFELYADLMASASLVRLTGGAEHRPRQLADLLVQSLAREPELTAGGLR
jgi:hypothetical protein